MVFRRIGFGRQARIVGEAGELLADFVAAQHQCARRAADLRRHLDRHGALAAARSAAKGDEVVARRRTRAFGPVSIAVAVLLCRRETRHDGADFGTHGEHQRQRAGAGDRRHGIADAAQVAVEGTVRQRPETAKGFLFLTLEDETGMMNIIRIR